MPAAPIWHARAAPIRAALAELDSAAVDRPMVEQLFGLSRRHAVRLMNRITLPRAGCASLVPREQLVAWLDRELAQRPVRDAVLRGQRLRAELAAARMEAARNAPIAPPELPSDGGWPAGIALDAPGALRIRFRSPEELLGRVLALAEQAAADYPAFARRLAADAAEEGKAG